MTGTGIDENLALFCACGPVYHDQSCVYQLVVSKMKTVAHTLSAEQRRDVLRHISEQLARQPGLRFAHLYGSVLDSDTVHDVDVALFLDDAALPHQATIAETLSAKLTASTGLPVDVRAINEAPLSFLFHVLRGQLLYSRDEVFLTDLMEDVARRYLDLAPLLRSSTKDAFAA